MTTALLLATLLGGTPMPEVTSAALAKQHLGSRVTLVGVLERVSLNKGKKTWEGTAVVLDDDTSVWVSYGAPPEGWAELLGVRVTVEGTLSPSLDDHAQALVAPHVRAPGKPKRDARAVSTLVGARVRLGGTARDAKGGAVLLVGDEPVYLSGLDAWPPKASGQAVVVTGTLASKQHLPEASRDASGAISQGASGKQLVLEAPQWRLASEPKP